MVRFGQELSQATLSNLKSAVSTILAVASISAALNSGAVVAQDLDVIRVVGASLGDWGADAEDWRRWVASRTMNHSWFDWGGTNSLAQFQYDQSTNQSRTGDKYDLTPGDCDVNRGNPINFSTGAKIEKEVDFATYENEMPFVFSRTYNSNAYSNGSFPSGSALGPSWRSTIDETISVSGAALIWVDSNGLQHDFEAVPGTNKYKKNTHTYEYALNNGDGSYSIFTASGLVKRFRYYSVGSGGNQNVGLRLESIANKNGVGWFFEYGYLDASPRKYLLEIAHTNGKRVAFSWADGLVATISDPAGNVYSYSYENSSKKLTNVISPSGQNIRYIYNDFGLTGKEYNSVRYSYFSYASAQWQVYDSSSGTYVNDNRMLAVSTEHGGEVERYSFVYDIDVDVSPGAIKSVIETNPLGKKTVYEFESGKLKRVTGQATASCLASLSEITYDQNGFKDIEIRQDGISTDYDFNQNGQLIKRTVAVGTPLEQTWTYVWDANSGLLLQANEPGGMRDEYSYNAAGQILSVTEINTSPFGVSQQSRTTTYSYTYHSNGLTASKIVDGPLSGAGDAVAYIYSAQGNLIHVQNSLGHNVDYSNYNALGQPGRIVGANGDAVEYTYDARGRVTKVRQIVAGVNADTDYVYEASGLLASRTDPDGVTTSYTYDAARRLTSEKRNVAGALASGATFEEVRYTYDAASNVTAVATYADNALKSIAYTDYDEQNRVRARRGNNGQNDRYAYDPNGNLKTVTDSSNQVTTLAYDVLDRVVSSTDSLGGITRFEYDTGNRTKKVTDPRGLNTTYVYDGFGQLWGQSSPDTGTTSHQYNSAGQLLLTTRNDGSTLSYAYDSLGRLSWYGTANEGRGFSYDWCTNGKGRVCAADYSNGTKHYLYTPQGQIQATYDWTPATGGDYTAYAYDSMGRVAGISYPSGATVGYGYSSGKLTLVNATTPLGVSHNVVNNIRYQPYGGAVSYNYGNGLTRNLHYDQNTAAGDLRLTGLTTMDGGATLQSLLMAYDNNNRITGITNFVNPNYSQSYAYDALSRLSGMTSPAGNETIQYDANGNRTMHDWLAPIANEVDPSSNRILQDYALQSNGIVYGHDGRGNRVSQSWGGSTATYVYDGYNRLKSVSRTTPSTYHNNAYSLVTYPVGTTTYQVNALDQRISKINAATTSRYVYSGQNTLLAENNNGQWTSHIWIGGTPAGFIRGEAMYWTHTDHLARPEMVTNSARQIAWRAKNFHSERGVILDNVGGYNLGLPGQYYDAETGLWYNGFRYYDSRLGRYTQSDPIGLDGGINTYGYAVGNPVNVFDPFGLDTYFVNRDLSVLGDSARSRDNLVTHTFVVVTNSDGSINATYSWGNDANLRGWNENQPIDVKSAREALDKGLAERVGDSRLDPYVRKAYQNSQKNRIFLEHNNGIVYNNCKTEANNLIDYARFLQRLWADPSAIW